MVGVGRKKKSEVEKLDEDCSVAKENCCGECKDISKGGAFPKHNRKSGCC